MFELKDLEEAKALVREEVPPTPQYRWPALCAETGADVWLKHENHTPTGAFKVRGGLTFFDALARRGELPAGVITATRGNHGQSIPYAAARHGVPVTVLVPEGNSQEKNQAMVAWGAKLEVFGVDFDVAREEAERRSAQGDLLLVPSFHEDLVVGVATYCHELLTSVGSLNAVYVPIGMGSGVSAMIRTRDLLGLETEVVGVVSREADAIALSLEQGRIIQTNTAQTFADGMACRVPHPGAFEIICAGIARIVRVSDDEVAHAMRSIFAGTHNVAEGAGAAGYAALLRERERNRGRQVAAVVTGGNVDAEVFAAVLKGDTPRVDAGA
ncbi:MAG: threonine dehydratase [Pseudomonadales bacterium]|nr:threonine dehydratase [Pseudomonadales bacterium]MDP6470193.1 threonine dehydratase [Pseudomonadales bacterium]MDP6827099.1 threonine dehydratase [Pseudomonadales bacterium]MDP6971537.1 threonine dehydratase [Pseudomonadales bacterium]